MRIRHGLALLGLCGAAIMAATAGFGGDQTEQCTSAVLSPGGSATGGAVLWKNRDTDTLHNKVVFVDETPHAYLGVVDADDASGRRVFAGLNAAGFAIMNTVAYNLPLKSGEAHDFEGAIMADALRTCRSVDDFAAYLRANSGRSLGSQANFGVIDATGERRPLRGAQPRLREARRAGDGREVPRGHQLLAAAATADAGRGLRTVRPGLGAVPGSSAWPGGLPHHSHPIQPGLRPYAASESQPEEWKKHPATSRIWLHSRHTINRADTSAAVVIVGKNPADPYSVATMWVIPGEPLTAVAVPLWVEAGRSPEPLWKGEKAPLWDESARIKRIIRPVAETDKEEYLLVSNLDNADGTGYLPKMLEAEAGILRETEAFLKTRPTSSDRAAFQDRMAALALAAMRAVK